MFILIFAIAIVALIFGHIIEEHTNINGNKIRVTGAVVAIFAALVIIGTTIANGSTVEKQVRTYSDSTAKIDAQIAQYMN